MVPQELAVIKNLEKAVLALQQLHDSYEETDPRKYLSFETINAIYQNIEDLRNMFNS